MKFNLPILLLFLAQFVWAISWLFTKKAIQFINPVFLYVLETMIGFLILFPLLFYYLRDFSGISKDIWLWLTIATIMTVLGSIVYFWGFQKTSLIVASLSALSFPLFVTILGIIFLHEELTLKFIAAALLFFVGFLILVL